MPRNTTTETDGTTETADSPMKKAMQQIDKIKDVLKEVIRELNDALGLLKTAEREQKASEKDIEAVREKLREIQSVTI